MTVGTLVSIVIIVIVALTVVRAWLVFSEPRNGRQSERKKLNLDRFVTVGHNQSIVVDGDSFKFSADSNAPLVMTFDQLEKITIITTDQGPLLDDAFMALDFIDGPAWLLPSEHPHYNQVYEALSACLPLDYKQYILAMASADNAEFNIWTRTSE